MVSEAGASVYSASEVAREEFPDLDLTVRGAISIARRLQDPLAELVKIDPKSIGVGQYQHDVSPNSLKKSLELVVDSCVNCVGVNLNTASISPSPRLRHRAGLAESDRRAPRAKGLFKSRQELLEVPRFSDEDFRAGRGLPAHPGIARTRSTTPASTPSATRSRRLPQKARQVGEDLMGAEGVQRRSRDAKDLTKELQEKLGEFTFDDIVSGAREAGPRPARRSSCRSSYRDDIHEVKDLKTGMICPGIVTNVTNFGAFVDIGVHQDGLVHISQLSDTFVKDPREAVNPGDRVKVKVLEVNLEKNQISLTMKGDAVDRWSDEGT